MIFLNLSLIFWKLINNLWFENLIDLLEQYGLKKQIVIYMKNKMSNLNVMTFTLKSIVVMKDWV